MESQAYPKIIADAISLQCLLNRKSVWLNCIPQEIHHLSALWALRINIHLNFQNDDRGPRICRKAWRWKKGYHKKHTYAISQEFTAYLSKHGSQRIQWPFRFYWRRKQEKSMPKKIWKRSYSMHMYFLVTTEYFWDLERTKSEWCEVCLQTVVIMHAHSLLQSDFEWTVWQHEQTSTENVYTSNLS